MPTQNNSSTKNSWFVPVLITFLLTAFIFGYVGYVKGLKMQKTVQPSTKVMPENKSSLPLEWTYKSNGECGVQFGIPPRKSPYTTENPGYPENFWDFPRGGSYPNLLSKLLLGNEEYKQASTMYVSEIDAGDVIPQAVVVSCIKNNNRFADNSQLISTLQLQLKNFNNIKGEKGMEPSAYIIENNQTVNRWGVQAIDLIVDEDGRKIPYTIFVTPDYIYEINVFGNTNDQFVIETAKKIFENLKFEN